MKTIEESFRDWESHVFGFGYGTGEEHTLAALKGFLAAVGRHPKDDEPHCYDYRALEEAVTPTVAWLLISTLCHAEILEYGVSPRHGWLTKEGIALKAFVDSKNVEELIAVCHVKNSDECYPDACNCGPDGYEKGRKCVNPFWVSR